MAISIVINGAIYRCQQDMILSGARSAAKIDVLVSMTFKDLGKIPVGRDI